MQEEGILLDPPVDSSPLPRENPLSKNDTIALYWQIHKESVEFFLIFNDNGEAKSSR
jgi:hypothetical protein